MRGMVAAVAIMAVVVITAVVAIMVVAVITAVAMVIMAVAMVITVATGVVVVAIGAADGAVLASWSEFHLADSLLRALRYVNAIPTANVLCNESVTSRLLSVVRSRGFLFRKPRFFVRYLDGALIFLVEFRCYSCCPVLPK